MKRNYLIVLFIFVIFFVVSFLTNILGPLIPDIIDDFHLSLTLAAFLPFSFFVAYGLMSIPSGMLIERYSEKPVLILAFLLAFSGALVFALFPTFLVAVISLFLIGIGMAMIQVAINPLMRVAGGEEHFAFNSVLAQLIFGSASFISPQVYSYMVSNLKAPIDPSRKLLTILSGIIPSQLEWVSLYWIFVLVTLSMIIILLIMKLPRVEYNESERPGIWETHKRLLKNPIVILYFFGIFAYVGSEQGVSNWISKFLLDTHGMDPQTAGASAVALFWGGMTAGCLLGLLLLKLFDSRSVLMVFSSAAIICLLTTLFGPAGLAVYGFALVGFFFSVMWSIVFSLALNSMKEHHGSFSGILCTGIVGGAMVPLIIGFLGDKYSLKYGMLFLMFTLGYLFSIGFWANPLIKNKTIKSA
jgi:FHS family L-fucose permease-like MFS transporter